MTGTIKKPDKDGYGGVITGDDGNDYYLHQSEFINHNWYRRAETGMRVSFDYIDNGFEMPRAFNINLYSKGKYVIEIPIEIDSSKPYPAEIIEAIRKNFKNILSKYETALDSRNGKMDYKVSILPGND